EKERRSKSLSPTHGEIRERIDERHDVGAERLCLGQLALKKSGEPRVDVASYLFEQRLERARRDPAAFAPGRGRGGVRTSSHGDSGRSLEVTAFFVNRSCSDAKLVTH